MYNSPLKQLSTGNCYHFIEEENQSGSLINTEINKMK